MKKIACCALCLLLALSTTAALAVNEAVALDSTRAFLELMERYEIAYQYSQLEDGDERVDFAIPAENTTVLVSMYFRPDTFEAGIRCWSLVTYSPDDYDVAIDICNQLNASYRWARFFADTTDDTITGAVDVAFTRDDAGDLCLRAAINLANIVDDAWPLLLQCAIEDA